MQDVSTLINGHVLSAKSCSFFVDMIPHKGFVAVNFKEKVETELVYDDQRDGTPVGITAGKYSVESFDFTMLEASWLLLMPYLAAKGLGSITAGYFGFEAIHSELIHAGPPSVATLFGCRVVGIEDDYQEDIKALVTKVTCTALGMSRNGFTLFDPKRAVGL